MYTPWRPCLLILHAHFFLVLQLFENQSHRQEEKTSFCLSYEESIGIFPSKLLSSYTHAHTINLHSPLTKSQAEERERRNFMFAFRQARFSSTWSKNPGSVSIFRGFDRVFSHFNVVIHLSNFLFFQSHERLSQQVVRLASGWYGKWDPFLSSSTAKEPIDKGNNWKNMTKASAVGKSKIWGGSSSFGGRGHCDFYGIDQSVDF